MKFDTGLSKLGAKSCLKFQHSMLFSYSTFLGSSLFYILSKKVKVMEGKKCDNDVCVKEKGMRAQRYIE